MLFRILLLAFFIQVFTACQEQPQPPVNERYPWQITLLANGNSSIFGVELGQTRVAEATGRLGHRFKTALFEDPAGGMTLEVYYAEFTRSGLSGRLVLTVKADAGLLQKYKTTAISKERLVSGVLQYRLSEAAGHGLAQLTVTAMTYLPYARLSAESALARFGEPAQKIRSHAKAEHWLYPDKGLDMILSEEGRDILQYVPPAKFAGLVKPLQH